MFASILSQSCPQAFRRIALAATCCLVMTSSLRADGITFTKTHIDLGKVRTAGDIDQQFDFVVTGNSPVEIIEIRPSCGCIKPTLEKKVYQPGEKGTIPFSIHATSQKEGPKKFQLSISTREPRLHTHVLSMDASFVNDITIQPSNLIIYMNGKKEMHEQITVTDRRPAHLAITEVTASSERLIPTVRTEKKGESEIQLVDLKIAADFPVGRHEALVHIRTNDGEYSSLEIPVTVVHQPRIRSMPEQIRLRAGTPNGQIYQIRLMDNQGKPIRIESITTNVESLKCEWQKDATRMPWVRVEAPPGIASQDKAEVTVKISEPVSTEWSLPITLE